MPSFREALTDDQIEKVIQHLRGFCPERTWPPGELNLPRPLVTEKAFPEDEWVLDSSFNATGNPGFTSTFIYEKRFGVRNQIEIKAPFSFQRPSPGTWYGGTGDMSLGLKRVLTSSKRTGSIVSLFGEAHFPTGNKARDLGSGATIFEGFAAYAQLLPKNSFLQFQGGVELPTHTDVRLESVVLEHGGRDQSCAEPGLWPHVVAYGGSISRPKPGQRREDQLGRPAATPGDAQQAAAHPGQYRNPNSSEQQPRSLNGRGVLSALGLLRRRSLRWLAVE